jgi:Glucose-6-phosphate dehydrogenase, C-terminal domain
MMLSPFVPLLQTEQDPSQRVQPGDRHPALFRRTNSGPFRPVTAHDGAQRRPNGWIHPRVSHHRRFARQLALGWCAVFLRTGKRLGPGMRLDKLSLQFAMHDTALIGDVLEAYERLILDAMRGDHTLFNTAEGIERLWSVSTQLLESPPPVRLYPPDSWGPQSIHQLIAPHAWRLPFERAWRNPNTLGA